MERIFWLKWTLYDDKVSELKTQKLYVENKHKGVLYFMFLNSIEVVVMFMFMTTAIMPIFINKFKPKY
jgi:hypothetical protein